MLFVLIGIAGSVSADTLGDYIQLAPLPGIGTATTGGQFVAPGLPEYLAGMFKLAIGLAGLFAVVMITLGGIEYMTSESIGGKASGKEKINQALIGLLLAIASWLILNTINPATLKFQFNPEPIAPIVNQTVTPTGPQTYYKNRICYTSNGRLYTYAGRSFPTDYECEITTPTGSIQPPETGCITTMYVCDLNRAPDLIDILQP